MLVSTSLCVSALAPLLRPWASCRPTSPLPCPSHPRRLHKQQPVHLAISVHALFCVLTSILVIFVLFNLWVCAHRVLFGDLYLIFSCQFMSEITFRFMLRTLLIVKHILSVIEGLTVSLKLLYPKCKTVCLNSTIAFYQNLWELKQRLY